MANFVWPRGITRMTKPAKVKKFNVKRGGNRQLLADYLPPEGVPISFQIASMGARFGAQFMDFLITYGGLLALLLFMLWIDVLPETAFITLFTLLIFFIRVPYYILSELVWNGRTLGKRIVKVRVISANGRRLTPHQVTARNLMKEVEVFTPTTLLLGGNSGNWVLTIMTIIWVLGVIALPFFNRKRQRLGDMIAGTIVVEQPKSVLLPDLARAGKVAAQRFTFMPMHLDFYGKFELQTLESILRDPGKSQTYQTELEKVTSAIINKIDFVDPVLPAERGEFLLCFYRAQREHLESRQLFGDRREDKNHKAGP